MMNFIILIIIAPVLYLLLGTVFGILLTLLQTDNLKLKIVLLTFLRPVTYTFLLSLLLPSLFDVAWIWLSAFALAVVLRDIIFSKTKFLSNVTAHNNSISIQYITTFLQTRQLNLLLNSATTLHLSDMTSIANYPASLKFGDNDDQKKFTILTKKIWSNVDASLCAANMRFAAMPADETQQQ